MMNCCLPSLYSTAAGFAVAAALLLAFAGSVQQAEAKIVEYNFTFEQLLGGGDSGPDSEIISPDCSDIHFSRRYLYVANGQYPGPAIEVTEGDIVRVTIFNDVETTALTVHWHGMYQQGTVYNDGVHGITQCSLDASASQTYEFVAYPAGTHFYHSHIGMTTMDGIAGPLIVHPITPDPFEYDEEQTLFISDFYDTTTSIEMCSGLRATEFRWIGVPNSLLLNGRGMSTACIGFNGTQPYEQCVLDKVVAGEDIFPNLDGCETNMGSPTWPHCLDTCNDTLTWTPSILVEEGKTYRFRIINGGGLITQNLAIENHTMTVVNVEVTNVVPFETTNLTIAAGQRYDVLVKADRPDPSITNYRMETTVMGRNHPDLVGRFILSYADSQDEVELPSEDYYTQPPLDTHMEYNDTMGMMLFMDSLHTLNVSAYGEDIDALKANETEIDKYVITLTQAHDPSRAADGMVWALNNITFGFPFNSDPLIYTAVTESRLLGWPLPKGASLSGTVDMPHEMPNSAGINFSLSLDIPGGPGYNIKETATNVVRLSQGDIVEFVLQNSIEPGGPGEQHPWHLHGNDFWVVGRGVGDYNATRDVPNYNLKNPVLRDTAVEMNGQWVAMRFVASNPGVWFWHCHIEPHLNMGMAFVLIVSPEKIGTPAGNTKYCTKLSLEGDSHSEAVDATVGDLNNNPDEGGAFLDEDELTENVAIDSSSPKMCLGVWWMVFAVSAGFMHTIM